MSATVVVLENKNTVVVSGVPGLRGVKGEAGTGAVLRQSRNMVAGQLMYQLNDIPPLNGVMAFINGLNVDVLVEGVNLTILGYTAGEIEASDVLKIFY